MVGYCPAPAPSVSTSPGMKTLPASFNADAEAKAPGAPLNQRKSKLLLSVGTTAGAYVNVDWLVTARSILISVTLIAPSGLHISLSCVVKLVMANENFVAATVLLVSTLQP